MENFPECETMCGDQPPPGHVFVGSLAEIDRRKVAEVVRGSRRHIRSLQYSAIRSDIGSPINDPIGYRIADNDVIGNLTV